MRKLDRKQWIWLIAIYLMSLGVYAGSSADRLTRPSSDNHYVYLAEAMLHGRLSLAGAPPHQNDWAVVEELTLDDGRVVKGRFLQVGANDQFQTLKGERLYAPASRIKARHATYYVSFPWFPSVLMLPFVALFGLRFNDVLFDLLLAALNPALVFFALRKLGELGRSARTFGEDLWLTAMFAFGTVYFFSVAAHGVWYTAHVVGVTLTILYFLAAQGGQHPVAAGTYLALGAVTRTPIAFAFPLVILEILRKHQPATPPTDETAADLPPESRAWRWFLCQLTPLRSRATWRDLILTGIPVLLVAVIAMVLNTVRFGKPFEFGHAYLLVRWSERIQRWGLFNYHFVSRNLAAMLTLLPRLQARFPYVQISNHGLSLFVTTPAFAYLVWPKKRHVLQPALYLSCLFPLILDLFYQNTGWIQFGYRFSLDFTVFLLALWAINGNQLGKMAKTLIVVGILVNTFGAITFNRFDMFYWDGMFPVP